MPSFSLNGSSLDFEPGESILEAARRHQVEIPTLCWYPKLPVVANCRVCLVAVAGQNKLVPACHAAVTEGMVVETETEACAANRRSVLELLLERYPGDHLLNGGRDHPRNEFEDRKSVV